MARISCAPSVAAFLDLTAASEGTSTAPNTHDDGYDVLVSGVDGPNQSSDYSTHPFELGRAPIIVRREPELLVSTASGRYQINLPTWRDIAEARGLVTFSPQNQDLAALELLSRCRALDFIMAGVIPRAITAASGTWASFPGNSYGQGGRSLEWLQQTYAACLAARA